MTDRERGYSIRPYAADQVRQIQREAFEAGRKAADDDLEWLRQNLFVRSWCGTIGRPCTWSIRGDYRHTTQKMLGNSLREAIDAAR